MEFKKYQHVERWGSDEVNGIEIGTVYVFPKIDGTNGSIWFQDWGTGVEPFPCLGCGSRKRQLSEEKDNAGFYKWVKSQKNIYEFFLNYPNYRLFGEWLVPHSLKTYRENAWRRFYIFDVCIDTENGELEYLPYSKYQPILEKFNLDYIPPITIIKNGTYEQFIEQLNKNVFLIEDGKGVGEGVVLKNYEFKNKYGRCTWAKIVTSEFKEKHSKEMGVPNIENKPIEQKIIDNFCTEALIEKTYSKIVTEEDGWKSRYIPRLFSTVYHDIIVEEMWNVIKKYKDPIINFRTLKSMIIMKVKQIKPELF